MFAAPMSFSNGFEPVRVKRILASTLARSEEKERGRVIEKVLQAVRDLGCCCEQSQFSDFQPS